MNRQSLIIRAQLVLTLKHTVLARLIKIEALVKLNLFKEAIQQLNQLNRGMNILFSVRIINQKINSNKF